MYAIILHAHQKLDRVARRHLEVLLPGAFFPTIRQILEFEAGHGPDGAKLKRHLPAQQPWHFVDPHDADDVELHAQLEHHYRGLTQALRRRDEVRAAFEAAWLAHALVDGLTPAHHYPYEKELEALRGEQRETRVGILGRAFVRGDDLMTTIKKSLKLVGPKGLLTTHALFEAGAYSIIAPLKLKNAMPPETDLRRILDHGLVPVFGDMAQEIARLKIYDRFYAQGWTHALSRDVRCELAPRMVAMVTLAWYAACHEAQGVPA